MSSSSLVFTQGQLANLYCQFVTTPAGMPIDVPDAKVAIYGIGGAIVLAPTDMLNIDVGFYVYDFRIPNSLAVGEYAIRYTGTVQGTPTAATTTMQVLAAGTPNYAYMSQRQVEMIAALEVYVGCAQHIPVVAETARRNKDRDCFTLSWPRWNLCNPLVMKNDVLMDYDAVTIDYDTGAIVFPKPLHDTDRVDVTYNFRFFTQVDMLRFLNDALSQINLEPPASVSYTLDTVPNSYVGTLMQGALTHAIQKLLFCLQFQQPGTIFGDKERLKDAISNFMAQKENAEKQFRADKATLKTKGAYPKIGLIVTPEYTLPGGRSRWFRYLFSSNMG
jgi:hypothetical protein